MENPFAENMTLKELRTKLFQEIESKTAEECAILLEMYKPLMSKKLKEELTLGLEDYVS